MHWKSIVRNDGTGIIQVLCGNGKGKTSAAVGMTLRAAGNGFTVFFIQFLKFGKGRGEASVLKGISGIVYRSFGAGIFLSQETIGIHDRRMAAEGLEFIQTAVSGRSMDMLVLDEIGAALELGLVSCEELDGIFEQGRRWLDIVLTGHVFPDSILDRADMITRMENVRHHYDRGTPARRGIEY